MSPLLTLTPDHHTAFLAGIPAMAAFKQVFGKGLSEGFIAELYASFHLGLSVSTSATQRGYDAIDAQGKRYQIKNRPTTTQNVDIRNFDFDYLVLVNMDANYQLEGMWRITVEQAQTITTHRENEKKYQVSQAKVKTIGERLV